jgi:hypothetical protein
MESGNGVHELYDNSLRRPPNSNPFPKGDYLLGHNVNHQGEIG